MLATEDGGDCSAARLLSNAEGCCARREPPTCMSSLHVPLPLRKESHHSCMTVASCVHESCPTVTLLHASLPLRKEVHTSRMTLLCRMHGGGPSRLSRIPPSCSTSSPTASACPQMIYSHRLPVLHRCTLGAEPQSGSLGLAARAGVSTECWALPSVRQRRVGQLLGLSISSPLAERVSGRTASVGPILPTALKQRLRLPGPTAKNVLLPPSRAGRPREVYLAAKKGHSGLRLALQDPAAVSLAPELASAGPARGQVVGMRWLRAWDTSGCTGPPAVPSGASARHLASCSCGPGRTC